MGDAFLLQYDWCVAVRRWSVSVEEDLAERVELRVGDRGLSGFVARAVAHELERDLLDEYLQELDVHVGPPAQEMVDHYDQQWPSYWLGPTTTTYDTSVSALR